MPLGRPRTGRASYIRTSNAYVVGRIPKSNDELASYLLATIEANRSICVAESCVIP